MNKKIIPDDEDTNYYYLGRVNLDKEKDILYLDKRYYAICFFQADDFDCELRAYGAIKQSVDNEKS